VGPLVTDSTIHIQCRLPRDVHAALCRLAGREAATVAETVRRIVAERVAQEQG
jgi:hypothetical protein